VGETTRRIGAYPGSFDPPTIAHLAIAEAAKEQAELDRVDFVLSRVALGKEAGHRATLDQRVAVLEAVAKTRPWLGVRITDAQLIADVAAGYDVLILGADKWAQVVDPAWYGGSTSARDKAVAILPRTLVVARPPHDTDTGTDTDTDTEQGDRCEPLAVADEHRHVSSTAVRKGRTEWMLPEAAAAGFWSNDSRND
jgi:hypothetical protein